MYSIVVRRIIRQAFAQIARGNYDPVVKLFSPDAEHIFYGNSALGGSRFTHEGIDMWYKRLAKIFPDLRFDLKAITVNGWPWATTAMVEWEDHFTLRDGKREFNQGVNVFRIKWGKVTSLRISCDTVKAEAILARLASQGVVEAAAAPIDEKPPQPGVAVAEPVRS